MKRFSTQDFLHKKTDGQKITVLTAYDFPTARMVDEADINAILVGDSLGNVVLGYETTIPVTLDEVVYHTKAVVRGSNQAMIIADMPFLTYHTGTADALRHAGRLMQEGGAQAVKLEGGQERVEVIKAMVDAGIPVMGHLGLTPQSVHQLGGFKVQGKTESAAKRLLEDALALEEAGVFALVLELIPAVLAKQITDKLKVPTIGIGAGVGCDGQVLVIHDMLGFTSNKTPKFVKKYCNLHDQIGNALKKYKDEVENGQFPGEEHSIVHQNEPDLPKLY
ncbi:MAG: 3-methyl-2-oxobutanoate hydroxymethyltransferase [Peptococcaceae bacterium]|nr:3-methyl-2-oxobutanoate hydroxymethyltransferase [Peptococcaceae bacterium]